MSRIEKLEKEIIKLNKRVVDSEKEIKRLWQEKEKTIHTWHPSDY